MSLHVEKEKVNYTYNYMTMVYSEYFELHFASIRSKKTADLITWGPMKTRCTGAAVHGVQRELYN